MTDVIDTQNPGTPDTGGSKPYYDGWGLSDDSVGFLQTLQYKDANALVEGLKQTRSYVGADKNTLVKVPKPDADGNVNYDEVYKLLGKPDKAEDYGFGDNDFAKAAAQKLFDLGISKKQATALLDFMTQQDEATKKASDEEWNNQVEQGMKNLRKEWQADYEANVAVAQQAVRDITEKTGFTAEELDKVEKALGTDKATKLFYSIGAAAGGVKALQNYNAGQETPEIAAYKLKELLADKETAKLLAQGDSKIQKEIKRLTELQMKGN